MSRTRTSMSNFARREGLFPAFYTIQEISPVTRTFEKIDFIREWAEGKARFASSVDEVKTGPGRVLDM